MKNLSIIPECLENRLTLISLFMTWKWLLFEILKRSNLEPLNWPVHWSIFFAFFKHFFPIFTHWSHVVGTTSLSHFWMHLFFLLLKPSFLHFLRSILSLKQLDIQSWHVAMSCLRQLCADMVTRKITKILIFFVCSKSHNWVGPEAFINHSSGARREESYQYSNRWNKNLLIW